MMKQIFIYLTLVFMAAVTMTGCHERYVTYSDAEYVMFADTMAIYPVQAKGAVDKDGNVVDSTFRIPVVSTVKRDYDRTLAVEIVDKGNNAIERQHYHLESNTITIKAGETRADVLVHGHYGNIGDTDSLGFELKLVMNENLEMPLYGASTKAVMMKSCPFDINDFSGYCVFTSMFLYNYSVTGAYQRLVKTEVLNENTILCRNLFNDGYDIRMIFNADDPMQPYVEIPGGQVISDEGSTFGTFHGDDRILIEHSHLAESVFYPCGKYLYVWTHIYVEKIGQSVGTVGHFYNIMEWITEEEAERLKREEGLGI
jgi:hypothetical protein